MKSQLQLSNYWIEELRWKSSSKPPPDESTEVLPKLKVEVFQADDEGQEDSDYLVRLTLSLTDRAAGLSGAPYQFKMVISGGFSFLEGTPEEVQRRMIHVNGSSILYGIARGFLADTTSHGFRGHYLLPSINLIKVLERRGQLEGTVKPDLS